MRKGYIMTARTQIPENELSAYYEDAAKYLLKPWLSRPPPYQDPIIVGGKGAYFYDAKGKEYLDFLSQLFNVNLGLQHKKVVEAVKRQVEELNYSKNTFLNIPKIQLAKRLAEVTHEDLVKTFFSNSGAEANEVAFKIVRLYSGRSKVIALWNAYHGSTFATMTAGGVAANRNPFEPLLPEFFHIPPPYCYRCNFGLEYPDCGLRCAKFLEDTIKFQGPETVGAFIADPAFTAQGILVPPKEYWPMIREICDKHNVVLIHDEVIAGCGRTGKLFNHEHWNIVPDILTLAKGLSNACVPLGATIMNKNIADYFTEKKSFMHGVTYSGHPLACAAGLAAINAYIEDKIPENAAKVGKFLLDALKGIQDRHKSVGDVRGMGLLVGVEFVKDKETKEPLVAEDPEAPPEEVPLVVMSDGCLEEGLLLLPAMAGSTVRISPPLILTNEDVDKAILILDRQITKVEKRFL